MNNGTLRVVLINLLAPVIGGILVLLAGCNEPTADTIYQSPPDELKAAQQLYDQGQYDKSYDACVNWLNGHNDKDIFFGHASLIAGKDCNKSENFSLAVMHLEKAANNSSSSAEKAEAKILLGDTYYGSGVYDRAIGMYNDVLAYHKGVATVKPDELYFKLGMAWKFVPNTQESDKFFEQIMDEYRHGNFYQMARREHSRIGNNGDPLKFFLAIGEYPSKGRAEEVVQALQQKGYIAAIQELESKETGSHVFRVAMENFETPKEARVMQRKLSSENIDSTIMP
ncbi:MAG TPA: SPOR domain-containing protein [Planctomycetota bacterium]|nr:SPOR domain-containing protein [Planctomycetota bacterium]